MKLDTRAFAFAAAIVAAVLFLICGFSVAVSPEATTNFAGHLIHADLSGITRSLTWGNFLGGLVCWTVGIGVVGVALAWLYNRLARVGGDNTEHNAVGSMNRDSGMSEERHQLGLEVTTS